MLTSPSNSRAFQSKAASGLALLLGAPFILFFGSAAIISLGMLSLALGVPSQALGFLGFLYLGLVLISLLCLHPGLYLTVSALGIATSAATLASRAVARRWRIAAALSLLAILAFPLAYRYAPALNAAPGYQLAWVTEPGFLEGLTKRAQITLEQRACTYTLLGWQADALHFQAACGVEVLVWRYRPGSGRSAEVVREALPALSRIEQDASELVRADGVQPAPVEPSVRASHLRGAGLASPDGRYVAVIARHLYGPEDVLVISPAGPQTR